MRPETLLCPRPDGLYCPQGDVTIDPVRPGDRAVITHGREEGFNMGSPVFQANGKVLARLPGGDRAILTGFPADEIDMMTAADPARFSADAHFRFAGCLSLDLDGADPTEVRALLERRFRRIARKSVLKAWRP